ncbi:MAG: hypothetical protein IKB32_04905 [Clostridia bacterium]|nr:hypothetical protein [Clostridia bacterium]
MIIDITGVELTPGNCGIDCLGNGEHMDTEGKIIECCCDECDYLMCCLESHDDSDCKKCIYEDCPRFERLKNL